MKRIILILSFLVFICPAFYAQDNQEGKVELNRLFEEVSNNFFSKGNNVEVTAQKAINLSIQLKDSSKLADLFRMMGVIQYFSGKHEKALGFYFSALKIYQAQSNHSGESRIYNEIGTVYKKNNRLDEAMRMFDKGYVTALMVRDTANMATSVSNSGIVYEIRNDLATALKQYFSSLALYKAIKDTVGQSYSHENIGGIYLMQKNYTAAEMELLTSLRYRQAMHLEQATAFSFHYLGELFKEKGDIAKAITMFGKCADVAERINYPDLKQRAYYSLAEVNKQIGNYKPAFDYFAKASAIKDSLFNAERNLQLVEMQTKYDVENKNKENLLLKQTIDLEGQKARNKNLLLFFISILSLGLIGGGSVFYYRRQQLTSIQTQLKIQRAEREQRIRISHDLHDNVGAQLSYVVSNLDIANVEFENRKFDSRRLRSVTEMSKQAIHTLRETVWALSNEAISIESFSDKFKAYTLKMSEFSENVNIEFSERIEDNHILPPNAALHLFRICQEAFSNALRHSDADLIRVEIGSNPSVFFQFKLADNGKGFNEEEAKRKGHYGLDNMKQRASEVEGVYSLITSEGKGTEILLTVPIKNTTYA